MRDGSVRAITGTGPPMGAAVLGVCQLNQIVDQILRDGLAPVWVEGEVTGWKPYPSGHTYFGLKEGTAARIDAVLWRGNALRLPAGVSFRDGQQVVVLGTLGIYAQRGQYRIDVQRMVPRGLGAGDEALRLLKQKLLQKGYFAPERKRPLPAYPQRVALVTSPSGAAIRDMLAVLTTLGRGMDVVICPAVVQGEAAPAAVAAALRRLAVWHDDGSLRVDAIIVGRGGGSSEDLSAFDSEIVADAIAASPVPVVSAVGHESDVTMSDLVADLRAATPTKAVEECARQWGRAEALIAQCSKQLGDALLRKLSAVRRELDALAARRALREPMKRLRDREQGLDALGQRLRGAAQRLVGRRGDAVRAAAAQLNSLSPLNVLARGYSLTERGDRRLLRVAADVAVDEVIVTRLHRGQLTSRVLSVQPQPNNSPS